MPMIARSVVVLPAPLRPSRVTTSPSATAKLMPCRMCDSPYQAWRSRTFRSSFCRTPLSGMPGPHVGLADFRIAGDGLVRSLGEDAAARQHGDGVRKVGDHREVVLDHQHGAVGG